MEMTLQCANDTNRSKSKRSTTNFKLYELIWGPAVKQPEKSLGVILGMKKKKKWWGCKFYRKTITQSLMSTIMVMVLNLKTWHRLTEKWLSFQN